MHPAHSHSVHAAGDPALLPLVLLLAGVLVLAYLGAAVAQGRCGSRWSAWRTASFVGGAALLVVAALPVLAERAHHELRAHMLQHLLLGMFAPLALVLGAPGTLLLRTLPLEAARRVVALLATRPVRGLTHPVTALVLDIGGMYVLYLTPLYALSLADPSVHLLVHLHFVISGYLFAWAVAGPDPAPHRPGMPVRLAVLFLATAAHATLGKLMYAYGFPRGTLHDPEEIRAAARLMYYGGDLAELLLALAFFAIWFRGRAPRPVHPA